MNLLRRRQLLTAVAALGGPGSGCHGDNCGRPSGTGTSDKAPKFGQTPGEKRQKIKPEVHIADKRYSRHIERIIRDAGITVDTLAEGFSIDHEDFHVDSITVHVSTVEENNPHYDPDYVPEDEDDFQEESETVETEKLIIDGVVVDKTNKEVGEFTREINLQGGTVYHASFFLDKEAQGKGIAATLSENQFAMYRKMGLSTVTVSANGDVGQYAWALQGFDFDSDTDMPTIRTKFRDFLSEKYSHDIPQEQLSKLKHSWDFARYRLGRENVKVGKEFMLKGMYSWGGELDLSKSSDSQKVFNTYLEASKAKKAPPPSTPPDPNQGTLFSEKNAKRGDKDSMIVHQEIFDNEDSILDELDRLFGKVGV